MKPFCQEMEQYQLVMIVLSLGLGVVVYTAGACIHASWLAVPTTQSLQRKHIR
jgi:hypothetical protein